MEAACNLCGELINERVKLLRCVACSVPSCRVQVHRYHIPEFCQKSRLKRKRKVQFAAWICFECRSKRSSSQRSLVSAIHAYDDDKSSTSSVGAIDEPAYDSSLASSGKHSHRESRSLFYSLTFGRLRQFSLWLRLRYVGGFARKWFTEGHQRQPRWGAGRRPRSAEAGGHERRPHFATGTRGGRTQTVPPADAAARPTC